MIRKLLWIDWLGALIAGLLVVSLHQFLADLHNLPAGIILFIGCVNIAYGCFSLSITLRRNRSVAIVGALAIANIIWLPVCLVIAGAYLSQITILGGLHVIGEGIYVAGLGVFEWLNRRTLADGTA
jgi:hypothetical protein